MTATEFHIASALRPLHAGGVHIWLAEQSEFELPGPVSKLSDDDIIPGGAAEDTGRHAGYFI
jgi:hypothetical protein